MTQSKKELVQKCHESAWDTLHFIFFLPQWPAYSRKWLLGQPMFQNENDSEQRFQLAWIGLLTLKSKTDSYFISKSGFIQKQQRIAIWGKQAVAKPQSRPENKGEETLPQRTVGSWRYFSKQKVHWKRLGILCVMAVHWLSCNRLPLAGLLLRGGRNSYASCWVIKQPK